jgi:two-component system, NarL family, sensor kinase
MLESRRLAADLHDGLGQTLFAAELALAGLVRSALDIKTDQHLEMLDAGNKLALALRQCRKLTTAEASLAAETVDPLTFLRNYCGYLDQVASVPLAVKLPETLRTVLSPTVGHHLSRIAQEAIANARRHSGATQIKVELHEFPEKLILLVQDNGRGISEQAFEFPGTGINCMRFRAEAIDALLEFVPVAGGGTRFVCSIDVAQPWT